MKKKTNPKPIIKRLLVIVGRTLQVVIILTFLFVCVCWAFYFFYPDENENKPNPQQDPPNLAEIRRIKI